MEEDSNIAVVEKKRKEDMIKKRTEYSIEDREEMVKREEEVRLKLKWKLERESGERQTAKAHLPDWEVYRERRYRTGYTILYYTILYCITMVIDISI